jgi:hypothetical protein
MEAVAATVSHSSKPIHILCRMLFHCQENEPNFPLQVYISEKYDQKWWNRLGFDALFLLWWGRPADLKSKNFIPRSENIIKMIRVTFCDFSIL